MKTIKPYKNQADGKKKQLTTMFNAISGNYDRLNRVISFGIDNKWRKKVVALVSEKKPENILDIATGTADLAIAMANKNLNTAITGLDISQGMLNIGQDKINALKLNEHIKLVQGDSEQLPFEDNTFDVVTVAFGIRNFETLDKGLNEIYRVLKPKGTFVILETSNPTKAPYKQGYLFYTKTVLPLIGRLFSKDKFAYTYLSESATNFPFGDALNNILAKSGFIDIEDHPQTFGVATIYTASK